MVTRTGNRGVVCATDDVSSRIEELQLTLGEGPCVDAVDGGVPVLVPDLSDPDDVAVDRWPAFMESAASMGVRAIFAFPLRIGAIGVGVLDLYRDRPGELDADDLATALRTADVCALALLDLDLNGTAGSGLFLDSSDTSGTNALGYQVHQATGMVQVQLGVSTEHAFLLLRARAFATDRSLTELAQDVVNRRMRFSAEDR